MKPRMNADLERTDITMYKVFKYPIAPADYFAIDLPAGAQILTVAPQLGMVCLWALVDPGAPLERREFRWAGTGHEIAEPPDRLRYVSTFQLSGGALIFHIFEVLRGE